MTALRAFITVGLSLLVSVLVASLIFATPHLNYTGVSRANSTPLTANVVTVAIGSPAYRAGLRSGDVVSCLSTRDRRNRLTGFMVYGIHRGGTQLDPDEIETLERLCASAAQAYTGIELAGFQGAGAILSPVPISS
ncbi:MAG: hypothetical protein JO165_08775 [Candidatus Eremiobacteraeota bacterium]|nr:hypothetical protein [Candidatus Eremiobacteraeota bacterium]